MRIWEIMEKHDDYKPYKSEYGKSHEYSYNDDMESSSRSTMGMRSSKHEYKQMLMDAYECGFDDGYTKALEEKEHQFGEKRMRR